MFCPECNHDLHPIQLTAGPVDASLPKSDKPTTPIVLDYCTRCGGVWSDQGKTNFIHSRDLTPLLEVLPKNPPALSANYQLLVCPKDKNTLRIFQRESVPTHLTILRCSTCGGIWFPHNSLIEFKQAQEAKVTYFKTWRIPLSSIYAVLLPTLFVSILVGSIFATLFGVNQGTDLRTRAAEQISEPLTISPNSGEMLISFNTKVKSITKIKYWKTAAVVTQTWVSAIPKTNHTLLLRDLEVGKTYSYQLLVLEPVVLTSPVYTFTIK
ncbi:MAG: hypothetical protein UV61_C0009G0018 [Candidatus Gottesmanbacteria bacterium GW2011_GWB1_43_11]|uniref:Transcription factor zinc-finger domain-containing protein n=1 Tax=Candidatus Gottesmanbacteria bacterium GW2011_GWB1_43_11 TaxID=1618446 RepID=A0A0G1ETR9_9BACT|nr:MAG: hypothetical protein UV17_C0024G0015 [Candidatus Gottesmanbacteria bacterium GW2011_GWA1_42_26]KKS81372.1 MAG: hypothetical protein UV55_C0015G0018 [Candidatus Gottesmanbacteria bacterium GW2011_GWC1_43_10]KKS86491.1 MAG: hypothetical protein UV61_C0009G0018 [Candidatus Gottesmanbacteria bacterium GW2011_GWB1_43_11]OGG10454.1 MAG: hypothetical protein A2699_04425 [Candidatus Gottesmanbacteria bacterium RIFCSPHIGHO2_01_FULL_43_15]OGG28150.1 MAG: hypothetical protein A3A59_03930 [Candidat